jgi:predicted AlkP superfamily pyrophosphatase or phosphodiesterase
MNRLLLFVFCVLCLWRSGYSQKKDTPYVILVSFDGFRYDYVEKYDARNFKAFIKKGTSAEGLIPSFPSKTFPNHYSIVTGLYPGHHGLIDNNFYDPVRRKSYEMKNRESLRDPSYYGGTPLWKLVHQKGLKSASFFWVGSELPQPDLHPDYYFPYNESVPDTTRIQQVLSWLKLPENERPHFITLYFSSPDHEGHSYGPSSAETRKAILNADQILGTLVTELKEIDLPINLVVVSDHGMEELKKRPETYIFLDELINRNNTTIKISNGGTQAHVYCKNTTQRDSLYRALNRNAKNYSVFKQEDFPAYWHYKIPSAGDLLITAQPGFYIISQQRQKFLNSIQTDSSFGVHGYDPRVSKNMRGIFYAAGPNIKAGMKIPAFENIHVYPFIARMLNLTTPRIDGDPNVLKDIMR